MRLQPGVQLGEAPQLEKVNEHGEFKRGKIGEGAESYKVSTYGKIVAINTFLDTEALYPLFGMPPRLD